MSSLSSNNINGITHLLNHFNTSGECHGGVMKHSKKRLHRGNDRKHSGGVKRKKLNEREEVVKRKDRKIPSHKKKNRNKEKTIHDFLHDFKKKYSLEELLQNPDIIQYLQKNSAQKTHLKNKRHHPKNKEKDKDKNRDKDLRKDKEKDRYKEKPHPYKINSESLTDERKPIPQALPLKKNTLTREEKLQKEFQNYLIMDSILDQIFYFKPEEKIVDFMKISQNIKNFNLTPRECKKLWKKFSQKIKSNSKKENDYYKELRLEIEEGYIESFKKDGSQRAAIYNKHVSSFSPVKKLKTKEKCINSLLHQFVSAKEANNESNLQKFSQMITNYDQIQQNIDQGSLDRRNKDSDTNNQISQMEDDKPDEQAIYSKIYEDLQKTKGEKRILESFQNRAYTEPWTDKERNNLLKGILKYGEKDWPEILEKFQFQPFRTTNSLAFQWRKLKTIMLQEIQELKSKGKQITKWEWIIAFIKKIEMKYDPYGYSSYQKRDIYSRGNFGDDAPHKNFYFGPISKEYGDSEQFENDSGYSNALGNPSRYPPFSIKTYPHGMYKERKKYYIHKRKRMGEEFAQKYKPKYYSESNEEVILKDISTKYQEILKHCTQSIENEDFQQEAINNYFEKRESLQNSSPSSPLHESRSFDTKNKEIQFHRASSAFNQFHSAQQDEEMKAGEESKKDSINISLVPNKDVKSERPQVLQLDQSKSCHAILERAVDFNSLPAKPVFIDKKSSIKYPIPQKPIAQKPATQKGLSKAKDRNIISLEEFSSERNTSEKKKMPMMDIKKILRYHMEESVRQKEKDSTIYKPKVREETGEEAIPLSRLYLQKDEPGLAPPKKNTNLHISAGAGGSSFKKYKPKRSGEREGMLCPHKNSVGSNSSVSIDEKSESHLKKEGGKIVNNFFINNSIQINSNNTYGKKKF